MKDLILSLFTVIVILFLSCADNEPTTLQTKLMGNWVNSQYTDSLVTFDRNSNLIPKAYGLSFQTDGKMVEHTIDGWCATPPVIYNNNAGTWRSSGSTLNITVEFWGGTIDYVWKIVSVDQYKLVVVKRSSIPHYTN